MKKEIAISWKRSKKPRKQRKYRYNAPLHLKHKMLSSHLSKDLRKKYNRRSVPLRKGDIVKVMRGEFKGKEGKVALVNTKKMKVFVEGIQRTRKDGTKVNVMFDPSNLLVTSLNLEDKKRNNLLEKKTLKEKNKKENA